MAFGPDSVVSVFAHAGHTEHTTAAFGFDPVLLVLLAIILLVIVAFYLFIRRTAVAFREGTDRGRR